MAAKVFSTKRIIIVLSIVSLLTAGRLLLPSIGETLVTEDEPEKSDLIVVLMGGGLNRVFGAVDLYSLDYGEKILMVENYQAGYNEADLKGISVPRDAEIFKLTAVQMGVPVEAIIILPGDAKSTQDEALVVRNYLQEHEELHSMIIVTSPSHSARAKKVFVWALADLNRDIKVLSCPNSYDSFNASNWWQSRDDAERVFLEYVKFINFYLSDRWK